MKIINSSAELVSETKKGNKKHWQCHIVQDGDNYYTQTSWYQITASGSRSKEQFSTPYFAAPTNVGRANERNSKEQAEFEYLAILKKQQDKGYRFATAIVDTSRPMPMLAHKFKDHKGKVNWPVFVQPKLNGMRMLFDGKIGWSRGNKEIIPDVIKHLQFDTKGYILDGELMLPNNLLLQETMKATKKYRPELSPQLLYHVYDIVDEEITTYDERHAIIADLLKNAPANVKLVPTDMCQNESMVMNMHKNYVSDGFEGSMIRINNMPYEIGKRSYSLLKLKDFRDEEFIIRRVIDGDGSDRGLAIFVLDNGNGQEFNCRPEGSQENRAELFKNRDELINKFLTVRFFEKSKDNIPIFPVGVSIRDWGEF